MRILIADDHEVVRRGLKQTLGDAFGSVAFGEASNAAAALQLAWKQRWDVVILDINMPGRSGLEALAELTKTRPKLPVLVLSMFAETEYAVRALKAGAAGYICKQSLASDLVAAVTKVLAGGRYITPAVAERLATELSPGVTGQPHEGLSHRELEVLRLLAVGKSVKAIAGELALSDKTVFTYRARLLEKLRLTNDVEVARYAWRHGLVH